MKGWLIPLLVVVGAIGISLQPSDAHAVSYDSTNWVAERCYRVPNNNTCDTSFSSEFKQLNAGNNRFLKSHVFKMSFSPIVATTAQTTVTLRYHVNFSPPAGVSDIGWNYANLTNPTHWALNIGGVSMQASSVNVQTNPPSASTDGGVSGFTDVTYAATFNHNFGSSGTNISDFTLRIGIFSSASSDFNVVGNYWSSGKNGGNIGITNDSTIVISNSNTDNSEAINNVNNSITNNYNNQKNEENERESDAGGKNSGFLDNFSFSVFNPFAAFFDASGGCTSIPTIKAWFNLTESQVCPVFPVSVRNATTPIVSMFVMTLTFTLIWRWLRSAIDNN
jgi:hypothetical protein